MVYLGNLKHFKDEKLRHSTLTGIALARPPAVIFYSNLVTITEVMYTKHPAITTSRYSLHFSQRVSVPKICIPGVEIVY